MTAADKPRVELVLCLAAALGCVGLLAWSARSAGGLLSRAPSGYYGLLTAGFRGGHLYVPLEPAPGLLALPDPYDHVAAAPYRVHDMSYWKGHYYLYFGVTPVLVWFWPVAALTGWYSSEALAVAVFGAGGYLAGFALLAALRRRYFAAAPSWVLPVAGACFGLANPVLALADNPRFYEVPIAAGFLMAMLLAGALYRALHAGAGRAGWIAAASLLYGLLVGCRPTYGLAGAAVLLAAAGRWRRTPGGRARLRLAAALVVPAALVGAGLMAYNFERFGSVFQFGLKYQLTGEAQITKVFFSPRNILPNVHDYLWGAGSWQRYFPFFESEAGLPFGLLRYLPWAWLGLAAVLPWRGAPRRPGLFCGCLLVCLLAAFLPLAIYCFAYDRYQGDFVPLALLLGGIGALRLAASPSGLGRRLAPAVVAAAAAASAFVGAAVWAGGFPDASVRHALARWADIPGALEDRLTGRPLGGLRLELELPDGPAGLVEPLLETGGSATERDWLQITYLGRRRARLGLFHAGLGLTSGPDFSVPADGRLALTVQMGSLLPPPEHPVVVRWPEGAYARAARTVEVDAPGAPLLQAALACYPSPPQDVRLGRRGWIGDGVADRFSGRILSARRLPLAPPVPPTAALHARRPVMLDILFPLGAGNPRQPLLATGAAGASDLLYFIREGGKVRFALDHGDSGGPEGAPMDCDPARAHRLQVWLGSLADPAGPADLSRRAVVWLDGALALNEEARFYAAAPESIRLGVNPFASTVIAPTFAGLMLGERQAADFAALPPLRVDGVYGAVDLVARFPVHAFGSTEPLVATGMTGAGDILYAVYADAHHIRFGFDHWGRGGPLGPPIATDYAQPHHLEITLGSLYAPGTEPDWAGRIRVRLDGVVVLEGMSSCYPASADQIKVGRNNLGGSTCGPVFTGTILRLARPAAPTE